jgi:hypothetical protein
MGRLDRLLRWARADPERRPGADGGSRPAYACRACNAAFEVRYHVCPECGAFSVDRRVRSAERR